MSQPSELPEWGTTSTNITDPPLSYKQPGWATNAQVPSGVINWLFNLIYQWIVYLKNLAGEAFTWTAAHVFSAGATIAGATFFTGGFTASKPSADGAGTYSTVFDNVNAWFKQNLRLGGSLILDVLPSLVTPTLASGYTVPGTGGLRCWKSVDGTVFLAGHVNHSSQANGVDYSVGTMPAGYVPSIGGAIGWCFGANLTSGFCSIHTDGTIHVFLPGAGSESVYYINMAFRPDAP